MRHRWIIPLLWAGQDHRRIVDLKIDGMASRAHVAAVGKALAAAPSIQGVVFRVSKHGNRVHVVLKRSSMTLREVEEALAAARKELDEAHEPTSALRLDEADLRLPVGTRFVAEGKEGKTERETTLAEFRKAQPFTSLDLPTLPHPASKYVCPEGCSAGDEEGDCPRCGSHLEKVPEKPADEG